MAQEWDAIVLGGGAAGLMCAARAGQLGKRIAVLERAQVPGKKILISGGGRCNFTNMRASPAQFISANRHFAKSALARYTPRDFVKLVDSYGIAWHEKTLGQLFCDESAQQIVTMLMDECAFAQRAGGLVSLTCNEHIASVDHADSVFTVKTQNDIYRAPQIVIATGGPSIRVPLRVIVVVGFSNQYAGRALYSTNSRTSEPVLLAPSLSTVVIMKSRATGVLVPVSTNVNCSSIEGV